MNDFRDSLQYIFSIDIKFSYIFRKNKLWEHLVV